MGAEPMRYRPLQIAGDHPWLRTFLLLAVIIASQVPAAAAVINVNAGDDFQAALNTAVPGDTIVLQAGATFIGDFVLPVKQGSIYITVRSSAPNTSLPVAGQRMTPAYAAALPKLKGLRTNALSTVAGSHHWRFENVEFLPNPAALTAAIVRLGAADESQRSLAEVPHHLIFDRIYMHDESGGSKRGIELNSATTSITNSYIAGIRRVAQETQAIAGWNGPGPFLIENNYIEAAAVNVMFGGADPTIPGLIPSDITFRRNHVTKSLTWRAGNPAYAGTAWLVKNLFELKNAQRVLIEGNVFEYSWVMGQLGWAISLTGLNDGGNCTWCTVKNVTFQNNIVRHANGGMSINGHNCYAFPGCDSTRGDGITVRQNLFYDISSRWDDGAGGSGVGRVFQIGNGMGHVTIDHNTFDNDGPAPIILVGLLSPGVWDKMAGCVYTNNLLRGNDYGVFGDESAGIGTTALNNYCAPGYTFAKNVLASDAVPPAGGSYPSSTYFPTIADFNAGFVNRSGANYRLVSSSPYKAAGTDGRDIGVNMDALLSAVAGVESGAGSEATLNAPKAPTNVRIMQP
jgi:hypothetical protein